MDILCAAIFNTLDHGKTVNLRIVISLMINFIVLLKGFLATGIQNAKYLMNYLI